MQLKFDWLTVLENPRRAIMVSDVTLEGPAGPRNICVNNPWLKMTGYGREEFSGKTPRLLQGKHPDHAVVGLLKQKLLVNPNDTDALRSFSVLGEWKSARKKVR